jgi:Zn-dependent protease
LNCCTRESATIHPVCHGSARKRICVQHPALLLIFYSALLSVDGMGLFRIGILCAILHEAAHVLTFFALTRTVPRITISLCGISLSLEGTRLPRGQELLLAAAGPVCNFLLCVGTLAAMQSLLGCSWHGYWFACTNLLLGAANLLPLPGLDGSRILSCLRRRNCNPGQNRLQY